MIKSIIKNTAKPAIFTKGTATMWTDSHISSQLLDVHLNPDIDLASRRPDSINRTISWIFSMVPQARLNILDLGCGPGLYTQKMSTLGHRVTGVDFSESSICYAQKMTGNTSHPVTYRQQDYLLIDDSEKFDLVTMIFTDFGVLFPEEQKKVLANVHRALKPGGFFIFDVMNTRYNERKTERSSWVAEDSGFWKSCPYIALSNDFYYPESDVSLSQHTIIDDTGKTDIYRFWTQYFSHTDLQNMMIQNGFYNPSCFEKILPGNTTCSPDQITFCVTQKP